MQWLACAPHTSFAAEERGRLAELKPIRAGLVENSAIFRRSPHGRRLNSLERHQGRGAGASLHTGYGFKTSSVPVLMPAFLLRSNFFKVP